MYKCICGSKLNFKLNICLNFVPLKKNMTLLGLKERKGVKVHQKKGREKKGLKWNFGSLCILAMDLFIQFGKTLNIIKCYVKKIASYE